LKEETGTKKRRREGIVWELGGGGGGGKMWKIGRKRLEGMEKRQRDF
jgi:hypothetical protein